MKKLLTFLCEQSSVSRRGLNQHLGLCNPEIIYVGVSVTLQLLAVNRQPALAAAKLCSLQSARGKFKTAATHSHNRELLK